MNSIPLHNLLEVILPKRLDIVIKYLAVNDWEDCMQLYTPYCKMQINKLWEKSQPLLISIPNQLNRFLRNIKQFKKGVRKPLIIGKDLGLIDGSHRLALHMYFNEKNVIIEKQDYNGKYGCSNFNDPVFRLFTYNEKERIQLAQNSLLHDLEIGRWK